MQPRSGPVHGGDLAAVGRRYGVDPASLLDFSANINPLGPPAVLLRELAAAAADVAELGRYPDCNGSLLQNAIARHLGIDPDAIVIANGAAALLSSTLAALRVRHCVVPTPAFSEDRHAVEIVGATWLSVPLEEDAAFALDPERVLSALDIPTQRAGCLITNPHNPSGAKASRETILGLAERARARGAITIVDEAFIDYAPEASVTRDAAIVDGLVTIRSLTKFFAVPALRVGYAVAAPALASRIRAMLPSWPVTTLALRALAVALDDAEYARETLRENAVRRARLISDLRVLGFAANPSAANFLLLRLPEHAPRAPEFVRRLVVASSIVLRDCSSYEGLESGRHVRVAVRGAQDNARLVEALARTLSPRPVP